MGVKFSEDIKGNGENGRKIARFFESIKDNLI